MYEEALYNVPYVAAVFNKSIISGEFFNFTLGKHTFNELSKVANSSTFGKSLDPFLLTLLIFSYTWLFNR